MSASTWAEFYAAHGQRNFTPVFNTYLDAQIADVRLPLVLRILAWVLRNSWGRHSDACVNAEGLRLNQVDCARDLGLFRSNANGDQEPDRKKVNREFKNLEQVGAVRLDGREIQPIDPAVFASSSPIVAPNATNGEQRAKLRVSDFLETVWKSSKPEEYQQYQEAERVYKDARTSLMKDFRAYTGMSDTNATTDDECRIGLPHDVALDSDSLSDCDATNAGAYKERTVKPLNSSLSSSVLVVKQALAAYANADDDAAQKLIKDCRQYAPDCTGEQIAAVIHSKAQMVGRKRVVNPIGYLMTVTVRVFEAGVQHAQQPTAPISSDPKVEASWRREQEAALLDPAVPEEEKRLIRIILGQMEGATA